MADHRIVFQKLGILLKVSFNPLFCLKSVNAATTTAIQRLDNQRGFNIQPIDLVDTLKKPGWGMRYIQLFCQILQGLRDRKPRLKGRCARCRYLDICNGNLRVRAEAVHGDVWASDPACYLTEEEIGL